MSKKSGFFLDPDDFLKNFDKITENVVPELAGKGLFNAENEVLNDAVVVPPQAPFKKGDLWGSRIVEKVKKIWNTISVLGGFNISYATKQHEAEPGQFNYTQTEAKQPGPKFLESKLVSMKEKYMAIVAATIKAGGK